MTNRVKPVSSLTNERIKAIRALDMRKERKETGLFVAEGASILLAARDNKFIPETLVYQGGSLSSGAPRAFVDWALQQGAEVLEVTEAVLAKIASKENPQSMLGVYRQVFHDAPLLRNVDKAACWLALEEVRDPGNLGTIIRTADAAGVGGIILVGPSCDPYSREAIRATMGSIFSVPLVRMRVEEFLAWRSHWDGDVVGTHLTAKDDFRTTRYTGPVLLIMGSEGPGLSDSLARSCSRLVKIPMAGKLDSLNLAVATALTLYQIRGAHLKL